MITGISILDRIEHLESWEQFLEYKLKHQNLRYEEEVQLREYMEQKRYLEAKQQISEGIFPKSYPTKKIINKQGTDKKRIVYSFDLEDNIVLKFIAFQLYDMDDMFSDNCYAFRRNYGAKNALHKILKNSSSYTRKYCLKIDISNYFNSIDVCLLLQKLSAVRERDEGLYRLFEKILLEEHVIENGTIKTEQHGAMAGTPIAPFLANFYLRDMDAFFARTGTEYFRYSDDILVFADTCEALMEKKALIYDFLRNHKLTVNHEKEHISKPGEAWEFLGFSYQNGSFDLSDHTKKKIKARIRRKAKALRRWQCRKNLSPDKAAIGFIRAMNRKFYGSKDDDTFTWNRWFFPNLTVTAGLREIDQYMQEYIRFSVTGRHYKGNYRIPYQKMKSWGYRSLVHEYYKFRKEMIER